MLMTPNIDNADEMARWDGFVRSREEGTPFHLSGWMRTIRATYSYEPILYAAREAGGALRGVFPLFRVRNILFGSRLVSLPFSDYGGPLFDSDDDRAEAIEGVVGRYGGRTSCIELRGPLDGVAPFVGSEHFWTHRIDLTDGVDEVHRRLNRKTIRYSIRKAEKADVRIEEESSAQGVERFYRLNLLTRKKHGVPPQPKKWFENLLENVLSRGDGFILLARSGVRTIAAGLFLRCGRKVCYKYSVSDPTTLSSMTPGHLLTWRAIEKSCSEGAASFDFGRTSPDNEGLKKYKEMWGAACSRWPYSYYPASKGNCFREGGGFLYERASCLWRRLPDAVTSRIGPLILKRMG